MTKPLPPCEVSWFSALCDDDYEFLGVPDPRLLSSFEHCRTIALAAEAGGFDNLLLPSGYALGIDSVAFGAAIAPSLLPLLVSDLAALGCAFRADAQACAIVPGLPVAAEADFDTEWLDSVLSIAVVDGPEQALAHIARHGSAHTEAIVTQDAAVAASFLAANDSAVTMWNASTQFCDGGEFGFGAEIGIATGRIHARGPVGPDLPTSVYW